MTRLTLALSIAALLIAAMALGWLLRLLWDRAARAGDAEALRAQALEARLGAAEAAREAAERRAETRAAQIETERDAQTQAQAVELAELRAERDMAMETVGALRQRLAALEQPDAPR